MTGPQATFLFLSIVSVLSAWACLFIVIPSALRSLFRHRLWRLRDEVMDQAMREELPLEDSLRLADRVEAVIHHARDVSPLGILLFSIAAIGIDVPKREPLSPELRPYEMRLIGLMTDHLFTGTPFGWVLSPILWLLSVAHRRRHQEPPLHPVIESQFQRVEGLGSPQRFREYEALV